MVAKKKTIKKKAAKKVVVSRGLKLKEITNGSGPGNPKKKDK